MSKVMDGGRTHKYSTGDGNLAKIILDINYFLLGANFILLIQIFEIYDENLNQLMKIIEIFVDNKIRRINRIIVEKICFNYYFCHHS